MNIEQSVTRVINFVRAWAKRVASLGLAIFVLLVVLKLYGLPTYVSIPSIDWQPLGVFVAGLAYYLHGTK